MRVITIFHGPSFAFRHILYAVGTGKDTLFKGHLGPWSQTFRGLPHFLGQLALGPTLFDP